jgi:hypothetical protein
MARKIKSRINSSKNTSVTNTDQIRGHKSAHGRLRAIKVGDGAPGIPEMQAELQDYTDVLLGRVEPPINYGVLTLMETADAYYARAMELTMLLQQAEREGIVTRGSAHYKFRTGELRSFSELAKRAADLGSRRLTQEQMRFEASKLGRDSKFNSDEYE